MAEKINLEAEIAQLKILAMQNARPLFDEKIAERSPSIIVDPIDGLILHSTKKANELFEHDNLTGKNIRDLMPVRFREGHNDHLKYFRENPKSRPMGHLQMNLIGVSQSSAEFNVEIELEPVELIGRTLVIATIFRARK